MGKWSWVNLTLVIFQKGTGNVLISRCSHNIWQNRKHTAELTNLANDPGIKNSGINTWAWGYLRSNTANDEEIYYCCL